MLMRYAAVTLLIAVLTPCAIRAQSPERESQPPSSQLKGQGPEVYKVKPQPDSPLRLSVKTYWLALKVNTPWTDPRHYEMFTSVENVSERAVSAYAVRHPPGLEIHGLCVRNMSPDRVVRPGQSHGMSTWSSFSPSDPVLTYEVDFVEFTDGTTWGADVCRSAERLAGERAGASAATARLLELLAGAGPDAVMKAVKEELAGWGPDAVLKEAVRLGLAGRGPEGTMKAAGEGASDVSTPPEHSPVWELGFFIGTKEIAYRVRRAVEGLGPGEIEHTLRRPYDAAGAK
jgi:hypothetical protein